MSGSSCSECREEAAGPVRESLRNSSGPLLDHQGNLQGVVTYNPDALKTVMAGGDIPQNVNFTLKASAAASFLESNRVAFETGLAMAIMEPADLADHAKAMSAFIACN